MSAREGKVLAVPREETLGMALSTKGVAGGQMPSGNQHTSTRIDCMASGASYVYIWGAQPQPILPKKAL